MGTPEPRSIRIGTTEREQAVRALGEHFALGRLEPEEFEERMTAAYAARTATDLDLLFTDLPRPGLLAPAAPTAYPTVHQPGPVAHGGHDPQAPYGRDPLTGQPYSDRSKLVAGLLQLFLPLGIGRLYSGHTALGVCQLVLSFFGVGVIWAFLDGIVILAGRPTDVRGRPLRP